MHKDSLDESYHVNMLVGLLLRYPEIYTITFNVPSSSCSLSYMISRQLGHDEFLALRRRLKLSLEVFYALHDYGEALDFKIRKNKYPGLTRLQITLEGNAILGEAISLLTKTMHEIFDEDLIGELHPGSEGCLPEITAPPEELPGPPPAAQNHRMGHLFAFRDAGKVYIYDK